MVETETAMELTDRLAVIVLRRDSPLLPRTVLVFGDRAADLARRVGQPAHPAPAVIRYGFWLHNHPQPILPHTVMDDFGRRHEGRQILRWMAANGYLQPRADLFGHWPDGRPDQVFARDVDQEAGLAAFVYPGESFAGGRRVTATLSLAPLDSGDLLVPGAGPGVPELAAQAAPAYWLDPRSLDDPEPEELLDILENII